MLRALDGWNGRKGPLHARIAGALQEAVDRGDLPVGTGLPPERQLARDLAVSRSTIVAAYTRLRSEGTLDSRQGSGTWVAQGAAAVNAAGPLAAAATGPLRSSGAPAPRSAIFRSLLETSPDSIELLGSHFVDCHGLTPELVASCADDLARVARSHGYQPLGLPELRRAIAAYLTARGLPTHEEEVLVTAGAQQAISLVAALLLGPGDGVLLEDPTYVTALDVFAAREARPVPVPVGVDGASLAEVRRALEKGDVRLGYFMPTFHNPTGARMPEEACRELVRLFSRSGVPLLVDDALREITLGDEPTPAAAFAGTAPVLTAGSLSKLFWGGLRVGWIRASRDLVLRLARLRVVFDLGGSLPAQVLAVRLLERAGEAARARRAEAAARLACLTHLLRERLPDFSITPPAGGLSLWVRLPFGRAADLYPVARRHGVSIVPGSLASAEGRFADHLRIPFVLPEPEMREAVERLAAAWSEYADQAAPRAGLLGVLV